MVVTRCTQGWGLANRVTHDKIAVDSVAGFLTKLDPIRSPRRFRQAQAELEDKKINMAEGKRWLHDHDAQCETCKGNLS